jgi:predicted ATPase
MRTLELLTIKNFKSIRNAELRLGHLNVFIGGNGSGKSNLIGVFHLMNRVAAKELQTYTGIAGGANKILHFGRKRSTSITIGLRFLEGKDANEYWIELIPTNDDRFIFSDETVKYHDTTSYPRPYEDLLASGHSEAKISDSNNRIATYVRRDLQRYRIYHFHDTSAEARVKQSGSVDDNKELHPDASNLAAFLFRLRTTDADRFNLIESTIRQIAPFFERFELEPSRLNPNVIRLEWREKGAEELFSAHALSDGTLRFICLATLFLQPSPPPVILIDEPELGLHPAAITLLASLLQSAATRTQILAATQSVTLVNQLTPEEVWVTDRIDGASQFKHLKAEDMSEWLDYYALGELWEKNLLGGRP